MIKQADLPMMYLPMADEVFYDLSLVSQRLLYVREQLLRLTRLRAAIQLNVPETTLREYEDGDFEPRGRFFIKAFQNDSYRPYIHFILVGKESVDYSSPPHAMPNLDKFAQRLRFIREKVFGMSRESFSVVLNNISPYSLKNYELDWREPAIGFLQVCTENELIRSYFGYLFFGCNADIPQRAFPFPESVNFTNRTVFKSYLSDLRKPWTEKIQQRNKQIQSKKDMIT